MAKVATFVIRNTRSINDPRIAMAPAHFPQFTKAGIFKAGIRLFYDEM